MKQIIECVPNFSEGKDVNTLNAIARAIEKVDGVKLLHKDSGIAANRTVYTFAGEIEAVFEAAFNAIKVASDLIDMRKQKGEHPRIGACDVCPFVPISGISLEDLALKVNDFAEMISRELGLPIFLYESNAKSVKRRNLASHRVGGYEALEQRMTSKNWLADYGSFNAKSGGTVMGARNFLVAYNINLKTKDAAIAQEIAYDLRALGRPMKTENGKTTFKPGRLKNVKAIGWFINDFQIAQVSINLTDFKATPIQLVFETAKEIASTYHTEISGSELIGLIPKEALLEAGRFYWSKPEQATEIELIQSSIKALGLSDLNSFNFKERILEYVLET